MFKLPGNKRVMILLKHMVSEIRITLASLLLFSCSNKVPSIDSCNKLYESNQTEDCFNCAKEYLKSHPDDLKGMKVYAKCAQSKQELEEVQLYVKNKFELFEKNIDYFMLYGEVAMRLKEHGTANTSYRIGRQIDSIYYNLNYMTAYSLFKFREEDNRHKQSLRDLNEILYLVDLELKYHPGNKNAQSFRTVLKNASDSLNRIIQ